MELKRKEEYETKKQKKAQKYIQNRRCIAAKITSTISKRVSFSAWPRWNPWKTHSIYNELWNCLRHQIIGKWGRIKLAVYLHFSRSLFLPISAESGCGALHSFSLQLFNTHICHQRNYFNFSYFFYFHNIRKYNILVVA